jgi:RNA polymerase-binding transcription factor DksA
MTKPDLDAYRTTLQAMRTRLTGDVSQLESEALRSSGGTANGGSSNAPSHPADLGTDNFEQEFALSLLQNQEQVLQEISDALDRIKKGSFGRCEECQGVIPKPRLQAVPYTRHCVACARKLQQSS